MRWVTQYHRTRRWLERLEAVSCQANQSNYNEVMDFSLAFFQNCWHLKDWILEDPEVRKNTKMVASVKKFAEKESVPLMMSQNIANGSKHLYFENRGRRSSGVHAHITNLADSQSVVYTYSEGGRSGELVPLARECLAAWDQFFQKHGIMRV
jgi:hypothetical protein